MKEEIEKRAVKKPYLGVRISAGVLSPEVYGDLATPGRFNSPRHGSNVCRSGT